MSGGCNRYPELYERLKRAVKSVCPSWLTDRQDDLVQVALIRVMEIERRSEGNREFSSSYLWRVAYSALIDEIRRLRRRREISLDDDGSSMQVPASSTAAPDQHVASQEIGEAIRDCLSKMVFPRRQAVTLHLQGHSVPEISRILKWTAKKAENLVYRGKNDLKSCLESKGLEP